MAQLGAATQTADDLDAARGTSFLDDMAPVIVTEPPEPVGTQTAAAEDPALQTDGKPKPEKADAKPEKDTKAEEKKVKVRSHERRIKAGTVQPEKPEAPEPVPAPPATETPAEQRRRKGDEMPEPEPFIFRAFGEDVAIPEAQYVKGHGVYVPEAQLGTLKQAWARNLRHDHVVGLAETARQETVAAKRQAAADVARWTAVKDQLSTQWLISLGVEPERAAFELNRIAVDIKNAELQVQLSQPAPVAGAYSDQPASEGDRAEHFDALLDKAAEYDPWKHAFADPKIGKDLRDELRTQRKLFEVPWEALPPAEQQRLQASGYPVGTVTVDMPAMKQRIDVLVQRFTKLVGSSNAETVALQVARRNNVSTGTTGAARPTVPPPAATASPSVTTAQTVPKKTGAPRKGLWIDSDDD